jgi:hypothetical protein
LDTVFTGEDLWYKLTRSNISVSLKNLNNFDCRTSVEACGIELKEKIIGIVETLIQNFKLIPA